MVVIETLPAWKTDLRKEPPAPRSCWERCCLWTGWRCSKGSGRRASGPDCSLIGERQRNYSVQIRKWKEKKNQLRNAETNSPGSDTQSLMVSVTSTEIQEPLAFSWTVRESMYRWVEVLFSSGLSSCTKQTCICTSRWSRTRFISNTWKYHQLQL